MKYQFEIEAGERLVLLRYSGQLTVEGLKQSLDELERHPDFDPGFDFIADYPDAKLVDSPGDNHLYCRGREFPQLDDDWAAGHDRAA